MGSQVSVFVVAEIVKQNLEEQAQLLIYELYLFGYTTSMTILLLCDDRGSAREGGGPMSPVWILKRLVTVAIWRGRLSLVPISF